MDRIEKIIDSLASLKFTLFCLGLMMALVVVGTLAQARMGTFAAQDHFFNSVFVYGDFAGFKLPFFPGGLLVGFLWFLNLLAAFAVRFKYEKKKKEIGILISHGGLLLLLVGQGLTQLTAVESRMAIEEGQTLSFIERARDMELAFVNVTDPAHDHLVSIPYSIFSKKREIRSPHLPFTVRIRSFFPNADLSMGGDPETSMATQGIGPQLTVRSLPVTMADDEQNNPTAYVEIMEEGKSHGVWLVSAALGTPQFFTIQEKEYRLAIRPRREYLPFSLTLNEFRHDRYPGTQIPKNFSSQVRLVNPSKSEERDVLIYMNNPLRYMGLTFYQASFGKEDTLSVFQVVRNPVWLTPYIACLLVLIGLAVQFLAQLSAHARRKT